MKPVRAWEIENTLQTHVPATDAEKEHGVLLDNDIDDEPYEYEGLISFHRITSLKPASWFRNRVVVRSVVYTRDETTKGYTPLVDETVFLIRRWSHKLSVGEFVRVTGMNQATGSYYISSVQGARTSWPALD